MRSVEVGCRNPNGVRSDLREIPIASSRSQFIGLASGQNVDESVDVGRAILRPVPQEKGAIDTHFAVNLSEEGEPTLRRNNPAVAHVRFQAANARFVPPTSVAPLAKNGRG